MIIDVHTHIYTEESYQGYLKRGGTQVSKLLILPFFCDHHSELKDLHAAFAFAENHDNVFVLGSVNMAEDIGPQIVKMEALFKQKKIVGIKLYPGYQHFYPSDEEVDAVAHLCAAYGKPLMLHSGMPYAEMGDALYKYAKPIHVDELAARCPKTTIIICHFGFPDFMDAGIIVSKNKNVYVEFSGIIDEYHEADTFAMTQQTIRDIKRVLSYVPEIKDKIMFGTDYVAEHTNQNQVQPYFDVVNGVFEEKDRAHVLGGLAEKLFFSEIPVQAPVKKTRILPERSTQKTRPGIASHRSRIQV